MFWVIFCVVGQPMALMMYFHDTVTSGGGGDAVASSRYGEL